MRRMRTSLPPMRSCLSFLPLARRASRSQSHRLLLPKPRKSMLHVNSKMNPRKRTIALVLSPWNTIGHQKGGRRRVIRLLSSLNSCFFLHIIFFRRLLLSCARGHGDRTSMILSDDSSAASPMFSSGSFESSSAMTRGGDGIVPPVADARIEMHARSSTGKICMVSYAVIVYMDKKYQLRRFARCDWRTRELIHYTNCTTK